MDENGEVFERSLTYRKIMKDQWIQGHFQIEHPNFNIQPTFETTPQPAQTPWSQLVVRVPQNGKAKGTSVRKGRCRSLKWCCHSLWGSRRKALKSSKTGLQQYPHLLLLMSFWEYHSFISQKEMKRDFQPLQPVTLSTVSLFVCPCNPVKGYAWKNDIVAH